MADEIPSVVDGLTQVQRMILLCALKNPDCQPVKEFSGYVAEHSRYRKQQQLLTTTITAMAQNYPGTNNINLLQSSPGSGSGSGSGSSSSSSSSSSGGSRSYTCTQLSSITPHIFRQLDQPLLNYMSDGYMDFIDYPPIWLVPIIPMALVNGSQGIGPKYDPHDIINNLRNLLSDKPFVPMAPRYKWFTREIPITSYTSRGIVEERDLAPPNRLFITELPMGKQAQDYEEFLKGISAEEPLIKEYIAHRDIINGTVTFEFVMSPDQMNKTREEGFEKKFGLTTVLNTDNMHFLDADDIRRKYDTPEEIMKEFVDLRLEYYEDRKSAMLRLIGNALTQLECLVSVFPDFCEEHIFIVNHIADELLYAELKNNHDLPSIEPSTCTTTFEDIEEERDELFSTLLDLKDIFRKDTIDLWLEELRDLELQLDERDEDEANRRKKWICDAEVEVEEEKPFLVSDDYEEQPPNKIEYEEPSEVNKCGSQGIPSSIPEDVSPPPLVKRDEEDETEKRKNCCWIPVSKKKKKEADSDALTNASPKDLRREDLVAFEKELDVIDKQDMRDAQNEKEKWEQQKERQRAKVGGERSFDQRRITLQSLLDRDGDGDGDGDGERVIKGR